MKKSTSSRREFVKNISFAGIAITSAGHVSSLIQKAGNKRRIGIIGLDTSHSIEFTKTLNNADAGAEFAGYKVVVAYPKGSADIQSSAERIPAYTEEIKKYGVQIAASIKELLDKVDVVLLETNDGRLHLEQALLVFKAGKPVFIDKPVAASLKDVIAIYEDRKISQLSFGTTYILHNGNVSQWSSFRNSKQNAGTHQDQYYPNLCSCTEEKNQRGYESIKAK